MKNEIWLQKLTWQEIQQKIDESKNTIILPFGSTEQHGLHLPVGTDTMVAIAIAEDAARLANVLVTPPLWFGWSPHHMVLPGTVTIRSEVLIEIVYDVVESLLNGGFSRFVFLNGHRIVNNSWLQVVGERVKREFGVKVVLFDPAYMSQEIVSNLGWGEVGHADEIESSQMMYYYPELVRMERIKDNPQQHHPRYHIDPRYSGDTLCYVPSNAEEMQIAIGDSGGTIGEPSKASKDGGKAYHEHLVGRLVEAIKMIQGL